MMKYWLALFVLLLHCNNASARKMALLVGVGNYAKGSAWVTLSSAHDVQTIKNTLLYQGFADQDIITVLDESATHDGILAAIDRLIEKVSNNDIVYFHFSGHGQQMTDDNGDESDGLDESIVPYDAPMRKKPGQKELHIRDDYLNIVFKKLKTKIGRSGQLIVSIDACHSGSGTRGNAFTDLSQEMAMPVARGTSVIYGDDVANNTSNQQEQRFGLEASNDLIAPEICFFGAGPQQLNYQYNQSGEEIGSLSYAISEAFKQADSNTTCRSMFDRIRSLMSAIAPLQTPQAEGNLDVIVFNGKVKQSKRYFTVDAIIDDRQVKINGGFLNGLKAGDRVNFLEPKDAGALLLTKGTIKTTSIGESVVLLQSAIPSKQLLFARAFAKARNVNHISLFVADNSIKNNNALMAMIEKEGNIHVSSTTGQMLLKKSKAAENAFQLTNAGGMILWEDDFSNADKQLVFLNRLQTAARSLFLKAFTAEDPSINLSASIILVHKTAEGYIETDSVIDTDNSTHLPQLKENTFFRIKLTNTGTQRAFFSILDIQPNDTFNIVIPEKNETPSSYSIEPLQTIVYPPVNRTPVGTGAPYGKECLKIIASTIPLDFSLHASRGINATIDELETIGSDYLPITNIQGSRGISSLAAFTKSIYFFITR